VTAVGEQLIGEFTVPSQPGNERTALALVADAVADQGLSADQLNRLKTAVAEAAMNAIEHGNANRPELDVEIRVLATASGVVVTISDYGLGVRDDDPPVVPDIDEKLAGLQSPRGWGLFLIKSMVDAMELSTIDGKPTVRLEMHVAEGAEHAEHGPHDRS